MRWRGKGDKLRSSVLAWTTVTNSSIHCRSNRAIIWRSQNIGTILIREITRQKVVTVVTEEMFCFSEDLGTGDIDLQLQSRLAMKALDSRHWTTMSESRGGRGGMSDTQGPPREKLLPISSSQASVPWQVLACSYILRPLLPPIHFLDKALQTPWHMVFHKSHQPLLKFTSINWD